MSFDPQEAAALKKLQTLLDEHGELFSDSEMRVLRRFAKIMLALETLGSFGQLVRSILIWTGGIIAVWYAFNNGISQWIKSLIEGMPR